MGFDGPQGPSTGRNPSDDSLAVGPDHILQTVNTRLAIFTKKRERSAAAIGYSFGDTPHYPGQRFAARLAKDPPGVMTLREAVLVEGEASQTNTLRRQDYAQTAIDPSDDCTIWYVGDYVKEGAESYSTRIGAFRLDAPRDNKPAKRRCAARR